MVILANVLFGFRVVPVDSFEISYAEVVFGQTLKIPGKLYEALLEIIDKSAFVKQLGLSRKINLIPFCFHNDKKLCIRK